MLVHFPQRRLWSRQHGQYEMRKISYVVQPTSVLQRHLWLPNESDVALLKEGCLKFIKEFKEIAGFNPFTQSITIAADMKQDKWHETGPNQLASIIESISIFERHISQN